MSAETVPAEVDRIAKLLNGPYLPVPDSSRWTLDELRETRWANASPQERAVRRVEARAILADRTTRPPEPSLPAHAEREKTAAAEARAEKLELILGKQIHMKRVARRERDAERAAHEETRRKLAETQKELERSQEETCDHSGRLMECETDLAAAEAERDALLRALSFMPGAVTETILEDATGLRPAMVKAREAQSEAETAAIIAHSKLDEIRAELLAGQGDDDGAQIAPAFEEGQTVLQMVCKCLSLLETRRDVIEGFEASLAAERAAHEETRRELAETQKELKRSREETCDHSGRLMECETDLATAEAKLPDLTARVETAEEVIAFYAEPWSHTSDAHNPLAPSASLVADKGDKAREFLRSTALETGEVDRG